MPREVAIRGERLLKRLRDAAAIVEAGGNPDVVMRSEAYKRRGLNTDKAVPNFLGSIVEGFKKGGLPGVLLESGRYAGSQMPEGGRWQSLYRGAAGNLIEGAEQAGNVIGNKVARALGVNNPQSDAEEAYWRTAPRVGAGRRTAARTAQGREGVDWTELAGGLLTPIPGPGKGASAAKIAGNLAMQGAVMSGLQPVTNAEGSFLGNKAAQVATGAAISGPLGYIFGRSANKVAQPSRFQDTADTIAAANKLGIDVGMGHAINNQAMKSVVDLTSRLPGGAPMTRSSQRVMEQFSGALEDTAKQFGSQTTQYGAGNIAQRGARGWLDRVKTNAERLYDDVDKHVSANAEVAIPNFYSSLGSRRDFFTKNPIVGNLLQNPKLRRFEKALTDEGGLPTSLTFKEAQELRKELGLMMGRNELINNVPRADIRRVYGALTEDMRGSLVGNEKGLKAFDWATKYWRTRRERVDNVLDSIIGEGISPGRAMERIVNFVKKDANSAFQIKNSMQPKEWDEVASYVFRSLGKEEHTVSGEVGTGVVGFLNDFTKLRKNSEAFRWAFGGSRYKKLAPIFSDMARVAENMKYLKIVANKGSSGYSNATAGMVAGLFYNWPMITTMIGGNMGFSVLMANPRMAKWILGAGQLAERAVRQGTRGGARAALNTHVLRLPAIAASQSEISDEITKLFDAFVKADNKEAANGVRW